MNWTCPACGAEDNIQDSLRCSCGYESLTASGNLEKRELPKRPVGFTIIALFLFWLVIAGVGNAIVGPMHGIFRILAMVYAITAAVAAIGLWKMKKWAFTAFISWGAVVFLLLIVLGVYVRMFRAAQLESILFFCFWGLVIVGLGIYIKRQMKSIEIN